MRYILLVCLITFFAYALGLVISNNEEVAVNLLFTQAPEMNMGLLLIISIVLGILIGILLSLQMFKVLQNKWEIMQLRKDKSKLKHKLEKATAEIEQIKKVVNADDHKADSHKAETNVEADTQTNAKTTSKQAGSA